MPHLYSKFLGWFKGPKSDTEQQPIYIDLAPTDQADGKGIYYRAFKEAMNNSIVFNIALTGPYGSGKSSIIQSILKKYKNEGNSDTLEISLAAFVTADETGLASQPAEGKARSDETKTNPISHEITKQEIERSILQQMLYGADANKLPRSRFKRIQSPSFQSGFNSALLLFGFLASWYLLENRSSILNGAFLFPWAWSKLLHVGALFVGGWFLWHILHHFYVASLGISLKSISLKDIELATAAADHESILNRHLDEIIYFFRATKYDLVIFEDLDRFDNHQIFVTLREINSLINKNFNGKRRVRFLYALRDDMFANTDRTKFFEFIIPVIPIINYSNSIDMVTEQSKRLSLDLRPSDQFLRDVARYLDDLRLIRNIFNEYRVYQDNLKTNGELILDPTNLFAVLIYKNVFPNDFEQLHRGKGQLAQILARHDEYIGKVEGDCRVKIAEIERQIINAEKQLPASLLELRKIYAMTLIQKIPAQHNSIGLQQGATFHVSQLAESDLLEQMIAAQRLSVSSPQGYHDWLFLAGLEAEVDPFMTFQQRKEAIEQKSLVFRDEAQKCIQALRIKQTETRKMKFHFLIREDVEGSETLFEVFGDQADLARFLVLEGYIDDTYYLYTSLFHAIRLSPNDNKFLKLMRGFRNPEPDFQIDNPKEVISEMRNEDFGQAYILNVKLVDTLLEDQAANKSHISSFVEFVSTHFADCGAFFKSYYAIGKNVGKVIALLVNDWDGFVETAMGGFPDMSHLARIIARLPEIELAELHSSHPHFSQFVSKNLAAILAEGIEIEPSQLQVLDVQVVELPAIAQHPKIARYLYETGLYQVSVPNLDFICQEYLGQKDMSALHAQHYTSIQDASDPALTKKIDADFKTYFYEVLLKLEMNTNESVEAIVAVLRNGELVADDLRTFLGRQAKSLPNLLEIPDRVYVAVLELAKMEATWENCYVFFASDAFDEDVLIEYLSNNATIEALSQAKIDNSEKLVKLRWFLLGQTKLPDEAYRRYVRCQPTQFKGFPTSLDPKKLAILIEESEVQFSATSFTALSAYPELQVRFIAKNIATYLQTSGDFAVDDDFRESLLRQEISDTHRLSIIDAMDLALLPQLSSRAGLIGPILQRTDRDISKLGVEVCSALIMNSGSINIQIGLLNRVQSVLGDTQVRQILDALPTPYSKIRVGWDTPRIPETDANVRLVTWLKDRKFISSWSQGGILSDDIRINLFRK